MLTHSLSKNTMDRWWWRIARIISLQKIYGLCGPEHHTVDFKWRCNPCGTENSTQTRANGLLEGWVSKKSKEIVRSAGLSRRIQSGVLSDSFEHHRALMTNLSDGLIGPALWSGIANLDFCNLRSLINYFSSQPCILSKENFKPKTVQIMTQLTIPPVRPFQQELRVWTSPTCYYSLGILMDQVFYLLPPITKCAVVVRL